jgi:hypothetical protein
MCRICAVGAHSNEIRLSAVHGHGFLIFCAGDGAPENRTDCFNTGAINRFKIRDYKFAILYFDEQENAVGIELTNEMQDGAIEIKQSRSNTYIRGKNFCDLHGIDYTSAHRYELRRDEETGFLFFRPSEEIKSAAGQDNEADSEEPEQDTQ